MAEATRPLVSFIVPTLNRGRYVIRAVESCLEADTDRAGVDVEVVVLDSESDDGSWEELRRRFGADRRVMLAQNRRGLGPTKSWLDGARLARGDYVTYLWSDDYISPRFLTVLVPALRKGAHLSVGQGLMRDLDVDAPLPEEPGVRKIDRDQFVTGYLRRGVDDGVIRPVSPACSLFSRQAFCIWIELAEEWCRATPLRQDLHWRRAIGPDLLLFLVALSMTPDVVPVANDATAQFSHHADSFSVAASPWSYETGYWLAGLWYPQNCTNGGLVRTTDYVAQAGALMCTGIILAFRAVAGEAPNRLSGAAAVAGEIWHLWCATVRKRKGIRTFLQTPREFFRLLGRFLQRPRRGASSAP